MNALRILVLCISAAMVCASLKSAHPQIATAVALAAGVAALMISLDDIRALSNAVAMLESYSGYSEKTRLPLLKLCGIAMIAEFASDICRDAGENSLAQRIEMGLRIGIVAVALPTATMILEQIGRFMP